MREGFEQFFRAQYPVVTRLAWSVVRDAHLAEDVAQEVMIAAGRRFGDFGDFDGADH
ncbi:MAG: RNA polymerase sigma factor, partial [Streptosporangiaceae bacterium]